MQTTKLIFLFIPIFLSGCAAAPLVITGLGVTGVVVNETTGKTMTDHAVSAANGQDCKVSRALSQEQMCQTASTVKLQVTTTGVKPSSVQEIEGKYR